MKSEIGANNVTTSNAIAELSAEMKSEVTNAKADVVSKIEVARNATASAIEAIRSEMKLELSEAKAELEAVTPISTGMHIVRFILNKDDDANFEIQYVTSLRITATKKENDGGMYKKSVILDYSGCYEMHRQAAQNSKTNRLLERMVKLLRNKFKQT